MKNRNQQSKKSLPAGAKNLAGNGIDTRGEGQQGPKTLEADNITICVPGILAGRAFNSRDVLQFLAATAFHNDELIDVALRRAASSGNAFQSEKFKQSRHVNKLRSLIEWRQVTCLARNLYGKNPELDAGPDCFESPFEGMAGTIIFSVQEFLTLFCEFFYSHREIISSVIIGRKSRSIDLAESLVIAETVMYHLGFATELDKVAGGFLQPTALQLQAWEVSATTLTERLAA